MSTTAEHLRTASELLRARRYVEAEQWLAGIPCDDEAFGEAISLIGRCRRGRMDWVGAEAASVKALELNGENVRDLMVLAACHHGQRKYDEACESFGRLIPRLSGGEDLKWAFHILARSQTGLGRHAEAEQTLRQGLSLFGDDVTFRTELAESLFQQKRWEEARAVADEALAQDPGQLRARTLSNILKVSATRPPLKQRWIPYPGRTSSFKDAEEMIRSSLLRGYPHGAPFLTPGTRFMAMGSCFAGNLAKRFRQAGRDVFYEFIGEDVNSTFANRYFLEWVEHGVRDEPTRLMEDAFGSELRQRYREAARERDVFVFTLGVAPCFFHPDTGQFFFMNMTGVTQSFMLDNFVLRMTSVQENADNLREIIGSLRRLSARTPTIVLTVSPVPLAATAERGSAVIADCVSKSTLRMACEQVLTEDRGGALHYWPSFEMVRWLGPYFTGPQEPAYGAQDGKTRHVSQWLIDLIIRLFEETYSVPEPAKAAATA